jgi:hypothetical protein
MSQQCPGNFGAREEEHEDQEGDELVPLVTSAAREVLTDNGERTAMPSVALAAPGTQGERGEVAAVHAVDRLTGAMQVHHGTAYALSFKADGSRKADEQIVDCGISVADTGSGMKTNARQRRADGSHGDEKKLEADNPARGLRRKS